MSDKHDPWPEILAQYANPDGIFSLLLLVGGEVVQKAIARLAGVKVDLPSLLGEIQLRAVAFSFGWVARAFLILKSASRGCRLMPSPECSVKLVNCKNGFVRNSQSWLLCRLVKDRESRVKQEEEDHTPTRDAGKRVSLLIDTFEAVTPGERGPKRTWVWYSSWVVIGSQLAISCIPWKKHGNWSTFMITACGTALALGFGALTQWSNEKWAAPKPQNVKKKLVALTRGDGHRYVILIRGEGDVWDLEKMASPQPDASKYLALVIILSASLWILLLITVTGLKKDSWYMLLVGGLGMIQHLLAAGLPMDPDECNIPLMDNGKVVSFQSTQAGKENLKQRTWGHDTTMASLRRAAPLDVMGALVKLELEFPSAGAALLPIFFPEPIDYGHGVLLGLRGWEKEFWREAKSIRATRSAEPSAPDVTNTANSPTQGDTSTEDVEDSQGTLSELTGGPTLYDSVVASNHEQGTADHCDGGKVPIDSGDVALDVLDIEDAVPVPNRS